MKTYLPQKEQPRPKKNKNLNQNDQINAETGQK